MKNIIIIACLCFCAAINGGNPVSRILTVNDHAKSSYPKAVDMPSILFDFNSTKIYREKNEEQKMYEQKVNVTIERAKKIFDEETTTVIEITGHCDSREKNKKKLSVARAQFIANELIKRGISKKRIVIKGEGDEEPLIKEAIIKGAKTEQEKEDMYLQNRRMTFKILRWDFKE